MYIYEHPDWPHLHWKNDSLIEMLATVRYRQGRLIGQMEALGFDLRQEAVFETLTEDVLKTSDIEGERLDADQVRSSVARHLGLDLGGLRHADRRVEGIVEMMLDATGRHEEPLTGTRLHGWHESLFPSGRSGRRRIRVGGWRDDRTGPIQVVSGPIGRERVHFEAPPAVRLAREMEAFLDWFNAPADTDEVVKAGVAHLWFVTLHPFDDGNGRMARAIADMVLARSEGSSQRYYSMSSQIRQERADYYDVLERTQKGTTDITAWLVWFLVCLGRAIENSRRTLATVHKKARFWKRVADVPLNRRQRRVLDRLLGEFEGKLTTSKWAKLAKCSQDTALRDITDLVRRGLLARNPGGGRSTSYSLVETSTS
ncbi:MAG: Fic family protein [Acidobacteriota bacterium]|nr:Fic family protein [Acidobacteriota bacterium]